VRTYAAVFPLRRLASAWRDAHGRLRGLPVGVGANALFVLRPGACRSRLRRAGRASTPLSLYAAASSHALAVGVIVCALARPAHAGARGLRKRPSRPLGNRGVASTAVRRLGCSRSVPRCGLKDSAVAAGRRASLHLGSSSSSPCRRRDDPLPHRLGAFGSACWLAGLFRPRPAAEQRPASEPARRARRLTLGAARTRRACLPARGFAFLTIAEAGWAHAIVAVAALAFLPRLFSAVAPRKIGRTGRSTERP